MNNKANDTYNMEMSISHSFRSKYRRKAIYGNLRADIGAILRELCE